MRDRQHRERPFPFQLPREGCSNLSGSLRVSWGAPQMVESTISPSSRGITMADLVAGAAFQSGSGVSAGVFLSPLCPDAACAAAACTAFSLSARLPGWSPVVEVAGLPLDVAPLGDGDGDEVKGALEDDAGAERLHPAGGRPARQRISRRIAIILRAAGRGNHMVFPRDIVGITGRAG